MVTEPDEDLRARLVRLRVPAATDEQVRLASGVSATKAADRAALRAVPLPLLGDPVYPGHADAHLRTAR
ncbi:MAG TPA: hypothetical protein VGD67_13115 [Pseudonocardiaceae bacterium]